MRYKLISFLIKCWDFIERYSLSILVIAMLLSLVFMSSCKSTKKILEIKTNTEIHTTDSLTASHNKVEVIETTQNVSEDNELITIIERIVYDTVFVGGHQLIQEVQRTITASSAHSVQSVITQSQSEETDKVIEVKTDDVKSDIETAAVEQKKKSSPLEVLLTIIALIVIAYFVITKIVRAFYGS